MGIFLIVSMQPEHTRLERFTAYVETLHKQFQTGILANMQDKPLWVLGKKETDGQGNIHKRLYTPRNYPASSKRRTKQG